MLLIIPVTIEIAVTLKDQPGVHLLLPEAFASNVGGTATLIGDPPNIMIGSYAKLSFVDFVQNLTVICAICLVVTMVYFVFWYKKGLSQGRVENVPKMIEQLREEYKITNKTLLIQCAIMLAHHHFSFHHPRRPAHGAQHRRHDRRRAAHGHQPGGYRGDAGTRDRMADTDLFHDALHRGCRAPRRPGLIQIIADWVKDISGGSLVVGHPDDPLGLGPGIGHH